MRVKGFGVGLAGGRPEMESALAGTGYGFLGKGNECSMGATRREILGSCGGFSQGGSLAQGLINTNRALRKQT